MVGFPPGARRNRALWLVLTAWQRQKDDFVHQKISHSHYWRLTGTQAILTEVVIPRQSTASSSSPIAAFENGFSLDAVDMPENAVATDTVPSHSLGAARSGVARTISSFCISYLSRVATSGATISDRSATDYRRALVYRHGR